MELKMNTADNQKKNSNSWNVYIITTSQQNRSYVGVTNNLSRRIRQHNEEIKGGAKYTKGHGPWNYVLIVQNLPKIFALQLEWAMHFLGKKRKPYKMPVVDRRIFHLNQILNRDRVTSKAVKTSSIPIQINLLKNGMKSIYFSGNAKKMILEPKQ